MRDCDGDGEGSGVAAPLQGTNAPPMTTTGGVAAAGDAWLFGWDPTPCR